MFSRREIMKNNELSNLNDEQTPKSPKGTIAVLTSGGDAPGMNAAIRAVVRTGLQLGYDVLGIKGGYNGLLYTEEDEAAGKDENILCQARTVSKIIDKGGTILHTARSKEYAAKDMSGVKKADAYCKRHNIKGLVVIGGDGTFRGARDLCTIDKEINCIAMPGTIDNDIACSEYTIGFDTAMNTAMEMIDKIRDTTESHHRCSVVEVMGRHAGYIALETGIATGASVILVPEKPFDLEKDVYALIEKAVGKNKHHFIIVVAEGVEFEENGKKYGSGKSYDGSFVELLAQRIEEKYGIESRATVLGHVQRGGSPTLRDRVTATRMGTYAVNLIDENKNRRVVVMKDGKITDYDILDALDPDSPVRKSFPDDIYEVACTVSL